MTYLSYDARGRPTQAFPNAVGVSHHPSGQVSQVVYANGVVTDVTFNARYWPERLTTRSGAGVLLIDGTRGFSSIFLRRSSLICPWGRTRPG